MNDQQFQRYSRHILLPEIDVQGQEKLLRSRIFIVGVGGLGAPAAMYLASSGIGQIVICDHDQVELNNLQRQIIHTTKDLGRNKVDSARDTLLALNPDVMIQTINQHLHKAALNEQVRFSDIVIDASDNFKTRFELNEACVAAETPLISGAVIRMSGQVIVFRNGHVDDPCYRCLYQDVVHETGAAESCSENGVLAPVAGIIGTILAVEALKLLLNIGNHLHNHLLQFDAIKMECRTSKVTRDPTCPVCAQPKQTKQQKYGGI